jgi:hypothetical protein
LLGLTDGYSLGDELGAADGNDVVGCMIGPLVSSSAGLELGASDGDLIGLSNGNSLVGDELGAADGNDVIGCRHHCWSSGWLSCRT